MTDITQLIERLRAHAHNLHELGYSYPADAIDEAIAEIGALREALKPFANYAKQCLHTGQADYADILRFPLNGKPLAVVKFGDFRNARAKLEGSGA
jgi:hypothetical protein